MRNLALDPKQKIAVNMDAIFCPNISSHVPVDKLDFTFSRRTGRIKNILLDNNLVATLRTDGGLALTIFGAKLLLQSPNFKENCGNNVRVGSDVAILNEDGNVIAVGRAVLSAKMIREFKRGAAVKVREGLIAGR